MQRLLVFFIRYYSIFLFLLLEGIAFWLIKEHTYYQGAKITSATNQTTGFIHGKIQSIIDYFNLKEENQRLALENMQLKNKSSDAFQFMTIQHNSISDTAHKLNYQYITAKVVYNS